MGRGFNIPWVGRSKYHRQGVQYTIGKGFEMPWVAVSEYKR
jgi:hypothetical protein